MQKTGLAETLPRIAVHLSRWTQPRHGGDSHVLLIAPSGLPNTGDPATATAKDWI